MIPVRYPFPAELAEREAEFDDGDDRYAQAVAAHLGRLAIAGTVSTYPHRERLRWALLAMLGAVACGVLAVAIMWEVVG